MTYDFIIIGGGIIGSVINYELSKYKFRVLQLEKRPYLANETSAGNSGYIHAGFDAKPGSLSAKCNMEGAKLWYNEIFKDLDFPREKIGSLVLAFSENEKTEIKKLYDQGIKNGISSKNLRILNHKEIKEIEPNISSKVLQALYCDTPWMIDPVKASLAFVGVAMQNGNDIKINSEVTSINKNRDHFEIEVNNSKQFKARYIINAAGHYGDVISKMVGGENYTLDTRRGQYLLLAHSERKKINNVCFMVPTIHGKGVVVTPGVDGRVQVGPTAKEGVPKNETRVLEKAIWEDVEKIGKQLIPSIDYSKVEIVFAGSRPIYSKTNDFLIKEDDLVKNFIHVSGIKSPGVSGAPYIAKMVVSILEKTGLVFKEKNNFKPNYKVL